ncbi:MAG: hypothetical protein SFV32_12440 [Opitutaceae bacterium]|nr:hypothetical protein [Opitutaceae bacterium]
MPISRSTREGRLHHCRRHSHTTIENHFLEDGRLSFSAKGLGAYLLSRPGDWRIIIEQLVDVGPDRHTSVRSSIAELMACGYLRRIVVVDAGGRVLRWDYWMFQFPEDGAAIENDSRIQEDQIEYDHQGGIKTATLRESTCGKSTLRKSESGKPTTTNRMNEQRNDSDKEGSNASDAALLPRPAVGSSDSLTDQAVDSDPDDEEDARRLREARESEESPVQEDFSLAEEAKEQKDFPWSQVMATLRRICPGMALPTKGDRRDAVMKKFWRDHGRSIGVFELLATRVQESDYIQARNGHTGNAGAAYPWSWVFGKDGHARYRSERILEGAFSNERMAFVLEKKSNTRTKVWLVGLAREAEIDLSEQFDGKPRWQLTGSDNLSTGLPEVLDSKP